MDIRQSPQYAQYLTSIGWQVEKIEGIYCYIKKIPIIGAFVKIQRPRKIANSVIEKLVKKYRPFQIAIEPDLTSVTLSAHNPILLPSFKVGKSPYLPSKTLQINLTQTKKNILQETKKDCRSAINKTRSLPIWQNPDIKSFHAAWVKSVGIQRYVPPTKHLLALQKAFGPNSLFLASHNGKREIMAGAIFLKAGKAVYYWQAFTGRKGRSSLAQYQLVWQGILWGKKKKARVFDFEGIYDPRFPVPSWQGFTHFKKSFGGDGIEYPGCFVKTYLPFGLSKPNL